MAALAVGMAAGAVLAQPVQWRVEDGGNGHWYEGISVPGGIDRTTAQAAAIAKGGHLVCLETRPESNWVFVQVASRPNLWWLSGCFSVGPWIGALRQGSVWTWEFGGPWTFENWSPGEPTGGSEEPCAVMFAYSYPACVMGPAPTWADFQPWRAVPPISYLIEYSADCNNDGIVDKGQILSGQLPDANNNGIPDGVAIITQPTDQNVGVDTPVAFVVEVGADATCTVPVTYQWQRRNPLVADAASPNAWIDLADGNGIFGTRAPNLTLLRPVPGLATGYRCKIGGGCGCEPGQGGFVYTDTVNFSVACPADFNADGGIDFGDVEAFFERWENGC
jgi:hypothetical protein